MHIPNAFYNYDYLVYKFKITTGKNGLNGESTHYTNDTVKKVTRNKGTRDDKNKFSAPCSEFPVPGSDYRVPNSID